MVKRRLTYINKKTGKKTLDRFYKYLDSLYLNVKKPGSFSGGTKLLREVNRRGYYKVENDDIIFDYLNGVPVYGLYKPRKTRFPTPPIVVLGLNHQGSCDLMSVQRRAEYNDGVNYLLIVIDDFSRYLRVLPLHNKEGDTVSKAMENILNAMDDKFKVICTDKGSEYRSSFIKLLDKYNVRHFYGPSSTKCPQVEIAIKNLRTRIARLNEYKNTDRYIDSLQDIIDSYNKTYHSSIKMAPNDVTYNNVHVVYRNLYKKRMVFDIKKYQKAYKFPEGTTVRISMNRGIFSREYKERFSKELFTVNRSYRVNGIELYNIKDCNNDILTSAFYADELTKFRENANNKYRIERVFDEELRGGKTFSLVQFEYSKCKVWVLKSGIKSLQ
jgi:hypothetical protein